MFFREFDAICKKADSGRLPYVVARSGNVALSDILEDITGDIRKSADSRLKLLEKPIDPKLFASDSLAAILAAIANATRTPVREAERWRNFEKSLTRSISDCEDAEFYFKELARTLKAQPNTGCEVFTHSGQPVFLRKGDGTLYYGATSALTLTNLTTSGIPIPQFSIVRLDSRNDSSLSVRNWNVAMPATFTERSIADVTNVALQRPTTFSLPRHERGMYYPEAAAHTQGCDGAFLLKAVEAGLKEYRKA